MSKLLNEEVLEMIGEAIIESYIRMGYVINELSTELIARAADEAEKQARSAPTMTTPHKMKQADTKQRQANKFRGELRKRRNERLDSSSELARDKIATDPKNADVKRKAEDKHGERMERYDDRIDKARKKGRFTRAIKRAVKTTNLFGIEGRRQQKRYGNR